MTQGRRTPITMGQVDFFTIEIYLCRIVVDIDPFIRLTSIVKIASLIVGERVFEYSEVSDSLSLAS